MGGLCRYFKPHVVRIIHTHFGKCLLCQEPARGTMIWIRSFGVVCPNHNAYALVKEYDDGRYTRQTIENVFATREEAERECSELNRRMAEARVAIGFVPISYVVKPLRDLVGLREKVTELEEVSE